MFDSVTARVIASAPGLSGVDHDRLPALITDAYVKVAVARSLLGDELIERDDLFDELRSIGAAQEAIALNLTAGPLREAAAYVAASAYRVLAEAFEDSDRNTPQLEPDAISPRIASMLLYLAADAAADAAEVAEGLEPLEGEAFAPLVQALRNLGRGKVQLGPPTGADLMPRSDRGPVEIGAGVGYGRCGLALADLLAHLGDPREDRVLTPGRFASIASPWPRSSHSRRLMARGPRSA